MNAFAASKGLAFAAALAIALPGAEVRAQAAPAVSPVLLGPAVTAKDLSLLLTTPAQKGAAAALAKGDFKKAAQLLAAPAKDAPTRWLKAIALRGAGKPAEARKLFELLALDGGPLVDRAMHQAGLCALEMGDAAASAQLLARVSLRSIEAADAMLERARQLLRTRPAGPALAKEIDAVLEPLARQQVRGDPAAALLVSGDAWLAAGDLEEARSRFRSAWIEHPLSAAAASARQRARAIPVTAKTPAISNERLVRRAELLVEAHLNREAIEQVKQLKLPTLCALGCPGDRTPVGLLREALLVLAPHAMPEQHQPTPEDVGRAPAQPADPLSCRSRLAAGRAYRKLHDYANTRTWLAPVVLRCADPDLRARALYVLAQLDTLASKPTAGPLWEALRFAFPQSTLADDALVFQAQARRKAGDVAGQRGLLQALVDGNLSADMRPEALFQLFWSLRADGQARDGLTYLDQLAALPNGNGTDEERARYWRARTLLDALHDASVTDTAKGVDREAARADLVWLVQDRPLTWYGLLARTALTELDPEQAALIEHEQALGVTAGLAEATQAPLHAGSLWDDPHLQAGIALLRLGLLPDAAKELAAVDRAVARAAGEAGEEPLILVADLLTRAGDLRAAHNLIRTELHPLLRRPGNPLALRAASLAYPRAFRPAIEKVAKSANVPPDLLQALMREESALDPKALSPSGALGLTQLMPPTARMVARKLKLKGFGAGQLMEPDTNIRLGGTYLGELLHQFGHPALALAAYNAGPGAVQGWLRARGDLPLDAFVEEIPLDETRGYVKRCLRSFAAYQYLAPGPAGGSRIARVGPKLAAR